MKKNLMKVLGLVLAWMIVLTNAKGFSASAANYTPIPGTTTNLTKYMVVEKNAEIPAVEFTFKVSAGSSAEATATTVKTWAGKNPDSVKVNGVAGQGTVSFSAGEATTDGALDGVATADEKYASKTITLDFSGVNYAEPGVYRYLLTETATSNSAVTMDPKPVRTIDVYVEDNGSGTLVVTGYVCYEGTVTDPAKNDINPAVDMSEWDQANPEPTVPAEPTPVDPQNPTQEEQEAIDAYNAAVTAHQTWENNRQAEYDTRYAAAVAKTPTNGAEASTPKSTKYVNKLDTADLTITKTVTGNQGSKDQYFEFTVTVNNAGANTVMTLDMSGAETSTHENEATSFAKADMDAANQKDDDGPTEAVLYTAEDAEVIAGEKQVGDVKVPASSGKAGQQIVADASGTASFKVYLHHGQQAVLKGLPKNATYTVVETAAAGYETTKTGDTGTINTEDVTAAFTNHRNGVIPTGVITAVIPGALLIGGAGFYFLTKKKEEEED